MLTRKRLKWKFVLFAYFIFFNIFAKCLPIISDNIESRKWDESLVTDHLSAKLNSGDNVNYEIIENFIINDTQKENITALNNETAILRFNDTIMRLESLRPGQVVSHYDLEITVNGDSFDGLLIVEVDILEDRGEPVLFHCEELDIHEVEFGRISLENAQPSDFNTDEGILEISPPLESASFIFRITYSGKIRDDGIGLYQGFYDETSYLAMNLYPTHARRVFPCADDLNAMALISLKFNNELYNSIIGNSVMEGNPREAEFAELPTAPHQWGLVAHNFMTFLVLGELVRLYSRPGTMGQESYASMMTQTLYNLLNEWTQRLHSEIHLNQDGGLHVFAMPDITKDWHALSTVAIWEPYILMELRHSIEQKKTALITMAGAYSRQWFGYAIHPQNWKYAWITTGLEIHTAYEVATEADPEIDVHTLFVTDVIQESLLRDSYESSIILEPEDDLIEENIIREHIHGVLKYKAPAIMRTLKLVLGEDENYIQIGARGFVNSRSMETINNNLFCDGISDAWQGNGNNLIEDIQEFLEPWLFNTGYPVIRVSRLSTGVVIFQERFGFSLRDNVNYQIPITYTTSNNPNFDNMYPEVIMDSSASLPVYLDEEDWILFNIQGQGYYRVDYDDALWENILEALREPDARNVIHPINRATLLDDVLNLARSGRNNYELAFEVVLTMELETEYAPWKAFIRNMEFLKKRLVAFVSDEDSDLDPDIYLRMVRRTITTFEEEVGFSPDTSIIEDPMVSLTRGLVMNHACRSYYAPCIAAAIDWFFDPNTDIPTVNPNIPHDIRPAVYCTMVREGGADVIEVLWERFDLEVSHYEKVVILESFACSHDEDFINVMLLETIDPNGRFAMEERGKFFEAVVESHYNNVNLALLFLRRNTNLIRDMYGGPDKLERIIDVVAENVVDFDLLESFNIWINSNSNNLEDSEEAASRSLKKAEENYEWNERYLEVIYEWIDENHAPTLTVSFILSIAVIFVHIFNN